MNERVSQRKEREVGCRIRRDLMEEVGGGPNP